MFNIGTKWPDDTLQEFQLFSGGKSCYVLARYSLMAAFTDFYVPGFLLMQQAIENLVKSILKTNKISWDNGKHGHDIISLLNSDKQNIFFQEKILSRSDFMEVLTQLQAGYNVQRYGQAGHYIYKYEQMMDSFDEMVFMLIEHIADTHTYRDRDHFVSIPVPDYIEKVFKRKLKQPFVFTDVYPL